MANWCYAEYTLTGDKQELDAVYELMHGLETMEQPRVENGFGTTFLGCLVDALDGDWENTLCRGEWGDLKRMDDRITFSTSTTWTPLNEVWDLLCTRYPSIRYYYRAVEGGAGLYETNDIEGLFYPERYHALYIDENEDYFEEWFETTDGVLAWVNEQSSMRFKNIEEIDNHYSAEDLPYCTVHKVEIISHAQDLLTRAFVKSMKIDISEDGECNVSCDLSTSGLSEDVIQSLIREI